MLNDAYKICKSQANRLKAFLIKEGIPLPDSDPPKPNTSTNDISIGVKITDDELANGVSIKIATAIVKCATGQAQSIRLDVGMIWSKFLLEMLTFSTTTLKELMRKQRVVKNTSISGEEK